MCRSMWRSDGSLTRRLTSRVGAALAVPVNAALGRLPGTVFAVSVERRTYRVGRGNARPAPRHGAQHPVINVLIDCCTHRASRGGTRQTSRCGAQHPGWALHLPCWLRGRSSSCSIRRSASWLGAALTVLVKAALGRLPRVALKIPVG